MTDSILSLRLLTSVAVLVAALLPGRPAQACACCDGHTTRRILGWSESGRTALVEVDEWAACDHRTALEVWRVDVPYPVGCFDLFGDPDARVSCDALQSAWDDETGHGRTAGESSRLRFYPQAPQAVVPNQVRVRTTPASPPGEADPVEMTVSVLANGRWHVLWSGSVHPGYVEDQRDDSVRRLPLTATVWPAPSGDRALLVIMGHDTMLGIGHFDTSLIWVDLPVE